MIQAIVLRYVAAVVLVAGLNGLVGCGGGDPPPIVATGNPPRDPGIVSGDDGVKSEVFASGHPRHIESVEHWLRRGEFVEAIVPFEEQGYTLAPDNGFTVDIREREISTVVTFLALEGPDPSGDRSVLMACYGVNDETGVSAAEFSSHDPGGEPGWRAIGELGWIRTGGDNAVNRSAAMIDEFSWPLFWDCLISSAPGTMVGCSYTCAFVGPGYWQCMLMCVSTQTSVNVVSCILRTILVGARDIKEDPR